MTDSDHDAAAREILAAAIHDLRSAWSWSGEPEHARTMWLSQSDSVLAALSAAGLSIVRTPEVGMAVIDPDDLRRAISWSDSVFNLRDGDSAVLDRMYTAITRAGAEKK